MERGGGLGSGARGTREGVTAPVQRQQRGAWTGRRELRGGNGCDGELNVGSKSRLCSLDVNIRGNEWLKIIPRFLERTNVTEVKIKICVKNSR